MPSIVCIVQKEIRVGVIEKQMVLNGKGSKYQIDKDSKIIPVNTIKVGEKVQLRHGWNLGSEQKVYVACRNKCGWYQTDNNNGYSLNSVFKPVRGNRSPWEVFY